MVKTIVKKIVTIWSEECDAVIIVALKKDNNIIKAWCSQELLGLSQADISIIFSNACPQISNEPRNCPKSKKVTIKKMEALAKQIAEGYGTNFEEIAPYSLTSINNGKEWIIRPLRKVKND